MAQNKLKKQNRMPLSVNEHVGDNMTHLFKTGDFTRSSSVNQYSEFSKQIPKIWRGLKIKYDITYNVDTPDKDTSRLFIPGFTYTDMLGKCLYFRVPNYRLNEELLQTILMNKHETIDKLVVDRIINSLADKYNLIGRSKDQLYDRVIFLPGSNIIDDILDFKKVEKLVYHEGAKVKPHPLTTKLHLFLLKKQFGDKNVLHNDASAFNYLINAKVVFCCKNSEMGIVALLLNKSICLVDNASYSGPATYGSIYNTILRSQYHGARDALLKILSSEYGGIVHVEDPTATQKMYNFFNSYNLLYKRP